MNDKETKERCCDNCINFIKEGGYSGECKLGQGLHFSTEVKVNGKYKRITSERTICFTSDVCNEHYFGEPECYYF